MNKTENYVYDIDENGHRNISLPVNLEEIQPTDSL